MKAGFGSVLMCCAAAVFVVAAAVGCGDGSSAEVTTAPPSETVEEAVDGDATGEGEAGSPADGDSAGGDSAGGGSEAAEHTTDEVDAAAAGTSTTAASAGGEAVPDETVPPEPTAPAAETEPAEPTEPPDETVPPEPTPPPEPVAADASVTGTVTYRERIALTPGAVVAVQLRDVSLQDVASVLIAEQVITNPGAVPIAFEVFYRRSDIIPGNTYGMSARIVESDGRLAFINDTAYDVITYRNPTAVDMVLVMVEPPPVPDETVSPEPPPVPDETVPPEPTAPPPDPYSPRDWTWPDPEPPPPPEPGGEDASVTGTVTYRERIALTPGAVIKVQLRDISLMDVASLLIAEQVITNPGQVPIAFEVLYRSSDIIPRHSYGMTIRIYESDGRLAFINDTAYRVITDGRPSEVDMVLVMAEPPPGWEG